MLYNRYEKEQKYINGVPATPAEYRKGDYLGQYDFNSLEDCENIAVYRWVETGNTICVNYSLCKEEKKQVSYDGQTWQDTSERRGGEVVKKYAEECGCKVLNRWELVGTTCLGFDAVYQYIKQYSYDMGETWENSDPPEYKYSAKEEFSEECVTATEPLTFEVTLPKPNMIVNIDVWEHPYKYVDIDDDLAENWIRYYINYGDFDVNEKEDFMEVSDDYIDGGETRHLIDEVQCKSHLYKDAGTYIIKIWGHHRSIKGLSSTSGMTYKVISWGGFMGRYVINKNYPESGGYPYEIYNTLFRIDMRGSQLTGIVADNHAAFGIQHPAGHYVGLERFIIRNANITGLPNGLLTNARALQLFQCRNTQVSSVPNDLFANCGKLDQLMECFADSPNLVNAPSFEGTKDELYLHSAFRGCTALQSATITNKIVTACSAFEGCTSLTGTVFSNCKFNNQSISVVHVNVIRDQKRNLINDTTFDKYEGGLDKCFMNAKLDGNPLNGCSFNENITSSNIIDAHSMFEGSGVTTFDIGFFNKPADLTRCFWGCPNLIVTGSFLPLDDYGIETIESMNGYTLDYMFATSGITNMSNIFINVKDGVHFNYGCSNCESLKTIDSQILTTFGNTKDIHIYKAFSNCHSLTSPSPKSASGQNVWDLYPYIVNGQYVKTLCFQGSYNMSNYSEIIAEWGGGTLPDLNQKPVILELTCTYREYGNELEGDGYYSYLPLAGKGWVDWGDNSNINYESIDLHLYNHYENNHTTLHEPICHKYTDGLTTHTVKVWFDDLFFIYNKALKGCRSISDTCTSWSTVEDLVKIISFGSVPYNELSYKTIPLVEGNRPDGATNDGTLHKANFNSYPNLVYVGKDEGAFKALTTASNMFKDCNSIEEIDSEFLASAINLNNVYNCFAYTPKLKTIGNTLFSKNKNITDFRGCFMQQYNSSELVGNTPVDENGLKLWQRAGSEGYPTSINGGSCFNNCTKLDDYSEIPNNWKYG